MQFGWDSLYILICGAINSDEKLDSMDKYVKTTEVDYP